MVDCHSTNRPFWAWFHHMRTGNNPLSQGHGVMNANRRTRMIGVSANIFAQTALWGASLIKNKKSQKTIQHQSSDQHIALTTNGCPIALLRFGIDWNGVLLNSRGTSRPHIMHRLTFQTSMQNDQRIWFINVVFSQTKLPFEMQYIMSNRMWVGSRNNSWPLTRFTPRGHITWPWCFLVCSIWQIHLRQLHPFANG